MNLLLPLPFCIPLCLLPTQSIQPSQIGRDHLPFPGSRFGGRASDRVLTLTLTLLVVAVYQSICCTRPAFSQRWKIATNSSS